jgi:monoamine oxidase
MPSEVDVVIIGAGAAGLAAARGLAGAPLSVMVLEARGRVGGRAWTQDLGGWPCDLGCGWLHSADRNLFVDAASELGVALDRTPPHWTRQAGDTNFPAEDQAAFRAALDALEGRVEAAADRGEDVPVSGLMAPGGRWNPLLDAFSSYYNGAEFDLISTTDYDAYQDSGVNWRAPQGYGALITRWGDAAPVALGAAVRVVDRRATRLRLEGPAGTVSARMAIVTVPTSLIAAGEITFTPDLPALRRAAEGLPLGLADKVVLALAEPDAWPVESHLFGDPGRTATGSYHLRPFGRPLIEVYLGGRHAAALEHEGEGAAAAFAIEELAALAGTGVRSRLRPLATTRWAADPWSRGSYSHALPGEASARARLAEVHDERIVMAGEAASPDVFSTAHGAAQTGFAAARAVLARLAP